MGLFNKKKTELELTTPSDEILSYGKNRIEELTKQKDDAELEAMLKEANNLKADELNNLDDLIDEISDNIEALQKANSTQKESTVDELYAEFKKDVAALDKILKTSKEANDKQAEVLYDSLHSGKKDYVVSEVKNRHPKTAAKNKLGLTMQAHRQAQANRSASGPVK